MIPALDPNLHLKPMLLTKVIVGKGLKVWQDIPLAQSSPHAFDSVCQSADVTHQSNTVDIYSRCLERWEAH